MGRALDTFVVLRAVNGQGIPNLFHGGRAEGRWWKMDSVVEELQTSSIAYFIVLESDVVLVNNVPLL